MARKAELTSVGRWLRCLGLSRVLQAKTRRMRVSETVSLGEKRFVSIIEVDGISFLVGGGAGSVSLLTQLGREAGSPSFQTAVGTALDRRESE